MKPKVYTIRYQLDEAGWWVASIDGVRGVHTQGRSLSQARRRIREALPLFIHERSFSLVDGRPG
jgi:predicted RNase H-like HicB family nuclease